jgi:hypothetical protein
MTVTKGTAIRTNEFNVHREIRVSRERNPENSLSRCWATLRRVVSHLVPRRCRGGESR